jgi:hypothetical protein
MSEAVAREPSWSPPVIGVVIPCSEMKFLHHESKLDVAEAKE